MLIEYKNYRTTFQTPIDEKQSFEICGVPTAEISDVCSVLETYIE